MKTHVVYVGKNFQHDHAFRKYIERAIHEKIHNISSINFFNESDNSLFLYLEKVVLDESNILIVTTKSTFSVVGKLICTITSDNQILQDNILLPSKTTLFEEHSYLLQHNSTKINIIQALNSQKLPNILLEDSSRVATCHLFEEDITSAKILLEPLAQTYDVNLYYTNILDGWIEIYIDGSKYGNLNQFIHSAKQLLPSKIIAASNLVAYIVEELIKHNKKITFAESCTGGLIASRFTAISGVSAVFNGSLITYSNSLKSNWLAVNDSEIEKHGVVSEQIVDEMSDGALNVSNSDYAISVSGIAGPDGGSEYKPVGTVYISVRNAKKVTHQRLNLDGDREYIQEQSFLHAIKMLILFDKEIFF
jgi:nicotinamide-nucleotide amidase